MSKTFEEVLITTLPELVQVKKKKKIPYDSVPTRQTASDLISYKFLLSQ